MPTVQQILVQYTWLRDQGMDVRAALNNLRETIETLGTDDRARLVQQVRLQETGQPSPLGAAGAWQAEGSDNQPARPPVDEFVDCPFCGRRNRSQETVCYACGELLSELESDLQTHILDVEEPTLPENDYFGAESVLILTARNTRHKYEIRPQARQIVLGRSTHRSPMSPDIDLSDSDANRLGVSRLHLSIRYDAQYQTLTVFDLGSANGTFVNGQRLHPHEVRVLHNNDELRLGNMTLLVAFQHNTWA